MQNFLKVKLSMIFEKFGIKSECPVILGYLIRFSPGVSDSEVEKYPKDAQLWSHLPQVILFLNGLKSLIYSFSKIFKNHLNLKLKQFCSAYCGLRLYRHPNPNSKFIWTWLKAHKSFVGYYWNRLDDHLNLYWVSLAFIIDWRTLCLWIIAKNSPIDNEWQPQLA